MRFHAVSKAAVITVLLSGCAAVGPDYIAPVPAAPVAWHTGMNEGLHAAPPESDALARWWDGLHDPLLTELMDRAVRGNLDLKQAQGRLREARARRGISAADRFPTVRATAGASRTRRAPDQGPATTTELYSAGFDATWELDIFGGKRRAVEAADATVQASEEALRDTLVSLLAEVALNYVNARTYQARMAIVQSNSEAQRNIHDITGWRAQAGLATALDVEQATFNLEQTRAQLPALRIGLQQAENQLAVLLGQAPGALHDELAAAGPTPVAPLEVAVGVPADTLRRRPDVRRAERLLAAQTARIGVASAARYPDFSLSGSIGLEALSLGDLFSSPTRASALGANLAWTLFDAGRLRRNVEIQTALQEQAMHAYESAVLTALQDVENALTAYAEEQARRRSLVEASAAARRAVQLATHRYTAGLSDFQSVLDAQRSALALEDQLAGSEGNIATHLIQLYKALGGGWTPLSPAAASTTENKQVSTP